jgi:8-oxo-dGTP pyrophosphatase MutT (NUDIX family)
MDFAYGPNLRRRIIDRLDQFPHQPLDREGLRHAAVGVVIIGGGQGGEGRVLLTKRPEHLKRHGGQYALPGGRLDDGETPELAALRELDEEMGLCLDAATVMGRLDDYPTRSGFRITPIVIWGPAEAELDPDPNEVAQVFHPTLSELNSPELPEFSDPDAGDSLVLSIRLPTTGGSVFAPTAAVLYQFREVALRGDATRVSHFDQPQFAWK